MKDGHYPGIQLLNLSGVSSSDSKLSILARKNNLADGLLVVYNLMWQIEIKSQAGSSRRFSFCENSEEK